MDGSAGVARAHDILLSLDLPVDWIGTSSRWGVEKPRTEFFERVAAECFLPPSEVAYVGDRLDNDVLPAKAAGLRTIVIRRGPWGTWVAEQGAVGAADALIDSLAELPGVLVPAGNTMRRPGDDLGVERY